MKAERSPCLIADFTKQVPHPRFARIRNDIWIVSLEYETSGKAITSRQNLREFRGGVWLVRLGQ
jgi:hypothetical protein